MLVLSVDEVISDVCRRRKFYDPRRYGANIKVLFIGESPPQRFPKNFFYEARGILFNAIYGASKDMCGNISKKDFLEFFAKACFYLIDMFDKPCVKLKIRAGEKCEKASNIEVRKAKENIRKIILERKPSLIIIILRRVCKELREMLDSIGIRYKCLRFPIGKYYYEFINELKRILEKMQIF